MGKTRITADWQDRDDEYTDTPDNETTVRYYANEEDADGYFYEMYVRVNGDQAAIIVTPNGVSIDFRESGESIHTNLVPTRMFPEHATLEWDQLNQILMVLRRTGIDGRFDQERWNSDDKRYWTRWLRREWKEELQERIKDHHANDKHDDLDKEERHTSDQRSHHSEW